MRVNVEAKPALYCPSLLKHTQKLAGKVAGTMSSKIKLIHCLLWSSGAGTAYKHLCWFLQPTTEQFSCLVRTDAITIHRYIPLFEIGMLKGVQNQIRIPLTIFNEYSRGQL